MTEALKRELEAAPAELKAHTTPSPRARGRARRSTSAGAGPVGLAAAYSALLHGAAVVLVGVLIPGRGRRRGQAGLAGLNPPRFHELEICDTYGA